MNQLLSPRTLQRVQANCLKADTEAKPLTVAEIFRGVTDGVWSDLGLSAGGKVASSGIIRRNLQREHVKKLTTLVLGERPTGGGLTFFFLSVVEADSTAVPPDARSLARFHLREIGKRIDTALKAKPAEVDETAVAHLEECQERIAKVLAASMQTHD